jgi:hypothetical protein|eukprot:7379827-Prymnesium_polylepis.2
MADVYASAVGTTVMQLKEIPARPKLFDGAAYLHGPAKGLDEAKIRLHFEHVVRCDLTGDPAIVVFRSHADALKASRMVPQRELCAGLGLLYNERSYDDRGWVRCKTPTPDSSTSSPSACTHPFHVHADDPRAFLRAQKIVLLGGRREQGVDVPVRRDSQGRCSLGRVAAKDAGAQQRYADRAHQLDRRGFGRSLFPGREEHCLGDVHGKRGCAQSSQHL